MKFENFTLLWSNGSHLSFTVLRRYVHTYCVFVYALVCPQWLFYPFMARHFCMITCLGTCLFLEMHKSACLSSAYVVFFVAIMG